MVRLCFSKPCAQQECAIELGVLLPGVMPNPSKDPSEMTLAKVEGVAMKSCRRPFRSFLIDRKQHLVSVPRRAKSGKWQGGIPI